MAVFALGLVLVLALSACGSSKSSSTASGAGGKAYDPTDVSFVANMTPHHLGGVDLGRLAASKGTDPEVKRLGQGIVDTQSREVGTLKGFLQTFGNAQPAMSPPMDERGMLDMKKLEQAPAGKMFDTMWLDVISGHHSAAIQMATIEQAGGKYPQTKKLAESIISTQTSELKQFNQLSKKLEK